MCDIYVTKPKWQFCENQTLAAASIDNLEQNYIFKRIGSWPILLHNTKHIPCNFYYRDNYCAFVP